MRCAVHNPARCNTRVCGYITRNRAWQTCKLTETPQKPSCLQPITRRACLVASRDGACDSRLFVVRAGPRASPPPRHPPYPAQPGKFAIEKGDSLVRAYACARVCCGFACEGACVPTRLTDRRAAPVLPASAGVAVESSCRRGITCRHTRSLLVRWSGRGGGGGARVMMCREGGTPLRVYVRLRGV